MASFWGPTRIRNLQSLSDQLETFFTLVLFNIQPTKSNLLPRACLVVVLPDEFDGKGVELRFPLYRRSGAREVPDVQKHGNQEVECAKRPLLYRESSITIRSVPAFDLNSNLPSHLMRIRVNAD